jgi:hypothetical protein
MRPSLPLLRHAAHYYNYSDAVEHVGTECRHACYCTPYGSSSTSPSSPPGDTPVNHHASTLEAAPVQAHGTPRRHDWGKIRKDDRQLPGTVCHTITRSKIVWHAYKSPSPWPIKGRRSPRRKDTGQQIAIVHTLSASPTILALASITPLGTWRPRLLSRLACSRPTTGTLVRSNIVPRAHPCWTYGPDRNQDKPSVLSCLAPTIERQISALITS